MGEVLFGKGSEDYQQAEWLAHYLRNEWRFDHTADRWHHWDGSHWAPDTTGQVVLAAASAASKSLDPKNTDIPDPATDDERKARQKLQSLPAIERALKALATLPGYGTNGDDWDADPYLLGVANGIVDLRTNTLIAHPTPDMLVTKTTGVAFRHVASPAAFDEVAPKFMNSMDEWMSGDDSMVSFLLLWFGASLFGFTPEQRFLLMTGVGRNGKGALKNAIIHAVGEYGKQFDANLYMRSKFGGSRSESARADLIDLKGKRIAFFSEPEGNRFNEELLKAHTGGDRITARALYSNNVQSWDPTHSITFLTNEAPEVDDLGPSMAARVMVADFRERYEGDKEDKQLYGKLQREAPGILGILCWAASAWYEAWSGGHGGISLPERVVEQSRAFMQRNDPVANWMNARVRFERDATCPSQHAYESFADWCREEGGIEEPFSQVRFAIEVAKKGFVKRRTNQNAVWRGFRLLGAMALAEREDQTDREAGDEGE